MFKKLHLPVMVFFLLSISLISSCYTVVLHQKNITLPTEETGSDPENYSHSIDISSQNSCTSCHMNDLNYNEFGASDSPFGASSLWYYYYDSNIPWWISRSNSNESAEDNVTELGDTGMRRYYGRRREALNNDNASSSITTNNGVTLGGGAVTPSFPLSTPTFGGTVTTTITVDSSNTQTVDTTKTELATEKTEAQNKQRDYGVRKSVKKK